MHVIREEGDFECNTGIDGKPVQMFQCRRDAPVSRFKNNKILNHIDQT